MTAGRDGFVRRAMDLIEAVVSSPGERHVDRVADALLAEYMRGEDAAAPALRKEADEAHREVGILASAIIAAVRDGDLQRLDDVVSYRDGFPVIDFAKAKGIR